MCVMIDDDEKAEGEIPEWIFPPSPLYPTPWSN